MPAEHVNAPSGIPWIEFGGDQQRLARWLGEHALPIRCVEEPPGPRTVAVATAQRLVRITTTGIT